MSKRSVADRPALTVWQAETLRLTAFLSPAAQITEPNWWEDLVGEPPETRILRPRKGGQQEEGPFEDGKLVLGVQPTRIDWLFTMASNQEQEDEEIPSIGPFIESLDPFLRIVFLWLGEMCPPVQRLAFGAVLILPVDDRQTGYREISAYLPFVQLDTEGSSDFFYQINRPRNSTSGIPGLTINRLSKWSVSGWRRAKWPVEPASVGDFLGQEHLACFLELDINTAPDFHGELHREHLSRTFQELVDLGKEIAKEGDIL